jgi:solute carrier family 13 (sodium-dependent dicarboxylate transporter), member 2/3/5
MKKKGIFIFSCALYILFVLPLGLHWSIETKAVALFMIAQILWVGRVFPLAYSSIVIMLGISFHILSFPEVISFFGSENVWLLFSTFILSASFLESGLAIRIALHMLKWSKGESRLLLLMSFLVMIVLAFLIPTNIGRASIVVSIFLGMVNHLEALSPIRNFSRSLFIGLNYIAILTGGIVLTGSNSSIYAVGIFNSISIMDWSYLRWMIMFAPPILFFVLVCWLVMLWRFPLEKVDRIQVLSYIDQQLKGLGRLSVPEVKMVAIMSIIVGLWITEYYHGYSVSLIGLLGAALTMIPFIGIWEWKQAKENIGWDFLIFFAASLAVAQMLIVSGALEWIAYYIVHGLNFITNKVLFLTIFGFSALLMRIVFANVLGYMTIMIPLSIMIGEKSGMFPGIWLAMAVFLIGMPGFFLVTQSPINLISFRYEYYTESQLLRTGSIVSICWLIIVLFCVHFYWSNIIAA